MIGPGTDNGYGRRNRRERPNEDADGQRALLGHLAQQDLSLAFQEATKAGFKFHNPIAITRKQLPIGLKAEELRWTPSGIAGAAPGAVNNVKLIDGVKGKAALLNDSVGFAAKEVGRFERTEEFSLDLWIRLRDGQPYDFVEVLYNQGFSGSSGYELALVENRLQFNLVHQSPYNMLSIQTASALPTGKWLHVSATYDGSSRANGMHLYLDGEVARSEVFRDNLTAAHCLAVGTACTAATTGSRSASAFQVNEFKDGALDEIRVFRKALNPPRSALSAGSRLAHPRRLEGPQRAASRTPGRPGCRSNRRQGDRAPEPSKPRCSSNRRSRS